MRRKEGGWKEKRDLQKNRRRTQKVEFRRGVIWKKKEKFLRCGETERGGAHIRNKNPLHKKGKTSCRKSPFEDTRMERQLEGNKRNDNIPKQRNSLRELLTCRFEGGGGGKTGEKKGGENAPQRE